MPSRSHRSRGALAVFSACRSRLARSGGARRGGLGPGGAIFAWANRVGTLHRDACRECERARKGRLSLCEGAAWFSASGRWRLARHVVAPGIRRSSRCPPSNARHGSRGHALYFRDSLPRSEDSRKNRARRARARHRANGGVGLAAGKLRPARRGVVAVVRSASHSELLSRLARAPLVVDPGTRFHEQAARRHRSLVLEAVGHSTFASSLKRSAGGAHGGGRKILPERVALNLGALITRGLSLIGGSGATRTDIIDLCVSLHQAKPFTVAIDRVLPLSRAEAAQRLVRAGGLKGRIVLSRAA